MDFERACLFVDGENLRHSICKLFESEFNQSDYLPSSADWSGFFESIVKSAKARLALRSYWYVTEYIDFWPWKIPLHDTVKLDRLLSTHMPFKTELDRLTGNLRDRRLQELGRTLIERERQMKGRFEGWRRVQEGITGRHAKIEFRRSGAINYDLFAKQLGREKAVDVDLGTDMLDLCNIYDVAVIVSGDQDYTPAVRKVKNKGKHVVSVSFLTRNNQTLPGGARRLAQTTDETIELKYAEVRQFMGFPKTLHAPSVTVGSTAPSPPSTHSPGAPPPSSSPPVLVRP